MEKKEIPTTNNNTIDLSKDMAGNEIKIPAKVERIISMAPSHTEILIELGLGGKIIAADTNTQKDGLLKQDIPYFNMMKPDAEKLIALKADIVFVSGMSRAKGDNPFEPLRLAGVCVVDIPSANSIDSVYQSIEFISQAVKAKSKGDLIISNMKNEITKIKEKASQISESKKKSVYFEISPAPYMYSFGSDTFMNGCIELIGAKNIFADQKAWISVSDEVVLAKNPDIILTNVGANQPEEILKRSGWNAINAIKQKQVFYIDKNSSSRPNHSVIKALKQIGKTIYPQTFK